MSQKIKVQDGIISYSAADPTELLDFTVEGSVNVTDELVVGGLNSTNVGNITTGNGTLVTPARLDITTGEYGTINIFQNSVGSRLLLNHIQWPVGTAAIYPGAYVGVTATDQLQYHYFILDTVVSDVLTTTDLNTAYPSITPGQVILGPTVMYYFVGSGEWRLISAPLVAP